MPAPRHSQIPAGVGCAKSLPWTVRQFAQDFCPDTKNTLKHAKNGCYWPGSGKFLNSANLRVSAAYHCHVLTERRFAGLRFSFP